jgi:hypothetical protein
LKLQDKRNKAKGKFHVYTFGNEQFQINDLVLKWDKARKARGKHLKFQKIWLGPYLIAEKINGSISTGILGKPPYQCIAPEVITHVTSHRLFFLCNIKYIYIMFPISFMHFLFSTKELIDIIASSYGLVDDNSKLFIKLSLSSTHHDIFFIYNYLHFTPF